MLANSVSINIPKAPNILLGMTFFILFTHLLSGGKFGHVSLFSYFVSLFYLLIFSLSFYFFLSVFYLVGNKRGNSFVVYQPTRLSNFLLVILMVAFFVLYVLAIGVDYDSFLGLRNKLVSLYRDDEVSSDFKLINTVGLLIFFFSSYLYLVSVNKNLIYAVSALIFPIFMTNRNFILVFAIVVIFKLIYLQKKVISALFFVVIFFGFNLLYVFIYDKGDESLGVILSTVLSILDYMALPLHGLTFSLDNPVYYGDFLTLPSSVVSWLGYSVSRDYIYTPYPNQTNVYTLFFSILNDFGVFGIAMFGLFLGLFHAYLYYKSKNSSLFVFVYLFSLYPMLMTFFDNTYTTSVGVWLYILIPFLFFKKVRLNESKYCN